MFLPVLEAEIYLQELHTRLHFEIRLEKQRVVRVPDDELVEFLVNSEVLGENRMVVMREQVI
jgi:hypothetical protein